MTRFKLGTNLIFAGNRFSEPEEWARIVREVLDLDYVQYSADVCDPLWPKEYVSEYINRTNAAIDQYHIKIESMFSGNYSRRHLLLHPDQGGRYYWYQWYLRMIDMGACMGATSAGSHFGAMTYLDTRDANRYNTRLEEGIRLWHELSIYAKEKGFTHLYFETMSIERELADTVEGARWLYDRLNESSVIPVYLCLDVGHAPHPTQRDPYRWLRELGKIACIIHLQQTDANNSRHWPFTPEYNQIGIIEPRKILDSIQASGAEEVYLHFEVLHRESFEQEGRVLSDLQCSVDYWRAFLKEYQEVRLAGHGDQSHKLERPS